MKRSLTFLGILGLLLGFNACERQKWTNTRELHLSSHAHDHDGEEHHAEGADKDSKGHQDTKDGDAKAH